MTLAQNTISINHIHCNESLTTNSQGSDMILKGIFPIEPLNAVFEIRGTPDGTVKVACAEHLLPMHGLWHLLMAAGTGLVLGAMGTFATMQLTSIEITKGLLLGAGVTLMAAGSM